MKNHRDSFRSKNILITGGLGFIGSNLAYQLVKLGAKVSIVDNLLSGGGGNIFNLQGIKNKVRIVYGDIRDKDLMLGITKSKDYIFNLASQVSHIGSMDSPYDDLDINCKGHLSILEVCKKNNSKAKVIFAGTRLQYGKALYLPVDEGHPLNPIDINGINKMTAEKYHLLYGNMYGIRVTSLRLTNTYGPRHQMRHSKQGFLNWFIRLAIDNKKINVYGNGKQLRDCNYVDDVMRALLLAAIKKGTDGEVFNLGGGRPMSIIELANLVIKIVGKGTIKLIPYPKALERIETGGYFADFNKIKNTLNWQPCVSLEEGIKNTLNYYQRFKKFYW